jgi:hypothetical protein
MLAWHLPNNLNFLQPKREGLMPLFVSGIGRRAALTLLSLFSPVYVYMTMIQFGLTSSSAVLIVISYYILFLVFKFIGLIIAEDFSRAYGFKMTIWWSVIPFVFFVPSIIYASTYPFLFILSSLLWGIHAGFFWWGYHGYFIKTGSRDKFGMNLAEAGLMETVISVTIPLLGGVMVSIMGFNFLFVFAFLLMVLSLLYLGLDYDKKQRNDVTLGEIFRLIFKHKRVALGYIGSSIDGIIYSYIWPLFLFLFFGKLISVAFIVSLSMLIASLYALAVGGWVDKKGENMVMAIGTPIIFTAWLVKFFQRSIGVFILADSFWNFGQRMVSLPLNVLTYKKALDYQTASAILFREINMTIGALIGLLATGLLVYFGKDLSGSFLVAALASLLPLVIVLKKGNKNEKK